MHRKHIERSRNIERQKNTENCQNKGKRRTREISLTVYKVDSSTGIGLQGAVFQLTDCTEYAVYGETNSDGETVFGLSPCGEYRLAEIVPPVGYTSPGHVYSICVDRCGCIIVDGWRTDRITVGNIAVTGRFTAIKIDGDNNVPLPGAAYTLYQNNSMIADTVSTETGAVTFTGLSPGTYELAETMPPAGFQMNDERLTVTVEQDGSVTIGGQPANGYLLIDAPLGGLVFQKQNGLTNDPLNGAVFALSQDGTEIATATSGPNGLVDFGIRPAGIYSLTETEAPVGFQLNNTVYQITVAADGTVTVGDILLESFIAENSPIDAFTAVKVNIEDGTPLAGAAYALLQNSVEVDSAVSTATGAVSFSNLAAGNYELVETLPPSGFQNNPTPLPVTVSTDGSITIMGEPADGFLLTDVPVSASFTATKVNIEDDGPLADATYSLRQDGAEIDSVVSTETGAVSFAGLSPGTYELVETQPPSGFQTNAESLPVVVAQDGTVTIDDQPADGFILNNVPLGELIFEKLDASDGSTLSGATFRLSQGGEPVDDAVSDAEGLVNFGVVEPGVYELEEIGAPAGYQPDFSVYEVVVSDDGTITVGSVPLESFNVENVEQPPAQFSEPPVIDDIVEGAFFVTGSGIEGASVEVRFPSGATVTALVGAGGLWTVDVPSGADLVAGQQVYASQTENGKQRSEETYVTVLGPARVAGSELSSIQ